MASGDLPPPRPRRERPLVAPGRERRDQPPPFDAPPPWAPPRPAYQAQRDPSQLQDQVEVSFTGPMPQRRVTVAFRFILALPAAVWAGLLGYAEFAVVFVAWFAALFTGQVPAGMARFVTQVLQYRTRVTAYGVLLLTDEYPPWSLDAPDYAVNVRTTPGRLNRAAVFFRLVLMVPSMLLSSVVFAGAQIVGVVSWLLTLVLGRLPTPLWEAHVAVLRYQTRASAFASLLTAEQPGGLLGDRTSPGTPDDAGALPPSLPARPRIVRLVLSGAGRRLVVLFGVVAVVVYASVGVLVVVTSVRVSGALAELENAHDRLELSVALFDADQTQCPADAQPECLRGAARSLADAFDDFADDTADIDFGFAVDNATLVADARDCEDALRVMAAAETRPAFEAAREAYRAAYANFEEDYHLAVFDVQSDDY